MVAISMHMLRQQRRGIAILTAVQLAAVNIRGMHNNPAAYTFDESTPLHVNKARRKNGRRYSHFCAARMCRQSFIQYRIRLQL